MSLPPPPDTLWYNGDWDEFVGISPDPVEICPCNQSPTAEAECSSRPPNEFNEPFQLLATYSDFDVTDPLGWLVVGLFSQNFTALPDSVVLSQITMAKYEIRSGVSNNNPGTLIASGTEPVLIEFTNVSVVSDGITYREYRFTIENLSIPLPSGKFFMNVAPVVSQQLRTQFGSNFLLFNSTTDGQNAVGVPPGDNANDFVVLGFPMPSVFIESTAFGQQFHDFSNGVRGVRIPICIHPDMEVTLHNGRKEKIRDLKPGAKIRTNHPTKTARLIINHRNEIAHRVMVHMEPGSLGNNLPTDKLVLTTNHPIVKDGKFVKPRELLNNDTIKRQSYSEPIHTHTLVTNNGKPVLINGVPVSTWSVKKWALSK
jgi:hypothetical protein